VQRMLDGRFPSPAVEYILLDARSRQPIALRWQHAEAPVPAGSLLKPFVALAFGRMAGTAQRKPPFPLLVCHGKSDGCWRATGHGPLTLEQALAKSCNAYFLTLARQVADDERGKAALHRVAEDFGLPAPPEPATAAKWIGVTPEWRVPPIALARAYASLSAEHERETAAGEDDLAARLRAGMRMAAAPGGTASKVGSHPGGVLAKTGTAPCVADLHGPRCAANGDGLVVAMAPAENPRLVLLVRQRGTTGAQTAQMAGNMLASLEQMEENHAAAQ